MTDKRQFGEEEVLALARDAYERGVCSFRIQPARSALLVIDMQDEFVKPHWTPFWVPAATRMIPRVAQLIESCRGLGLPIIYTMFAFTHRYLDRPSSGAHMPNRYPQIPADPAWFRDGKIASPLQPRSEDIVILKPSYGAFYDTPLETILKNLGRDTILICGTLTDFCCGMTARQGYERGFQVVFGSDVTATDDPAIHENELKVLRKGFARVMPSDEIVAALHREIDGPPTSSSPAT
jgi:nicotinamidase-related amidase